VEHPSHSTQSTPSVKAVLRSTIRMEEGEETLVGRGNILELIS